MFSRLTHPRLWSATAPLALFSYLSAPTSAHASASSSPLSTAAAVDVDVVGIITAALQIVGDIVRLALAIVGAAT